MCYNQFKIILVDLTMGQLLERTDETITFKISPFDVTSQEIQRFVEETLKVRLGLHTFFSSVCAMQFVALHKHENLPPIKKKQQS